MITEGHLRAARALLGWQQADVAQSAGVSRATIGVYERSLEKAYGPTLAAIVHAYESAGIEFLFDPPGIRLRADEG